MDNSGSFNDYDDVIDTWPFNIQDDDLDYNYNYNDNPRWIDVPHSINGLVNYSVRFNDYDNVIYDAHLGEGGPLDCM